MATSPALSIKSTHSWARQQHQSAERWWCSPHCIGFSISVLVGAIELEKKWSIVQSCVALLRCQSVWCAPIYQECEEILFAAVLNECHAKRKPLHLRCMLQCHLHQHMSNCCNTLLSFAASLIWKVQSSRLAHTWQREIPFFLEREPIWDTLYLDWEPAEGMLKNYQSWQRRIILSILLLLFGLFPLGALVNNWQ
jgi:hypothetical protein